MQKISVLVGSLCLALFAVACGGGEDGQDGPPGQDGDRVTLIDLDEGHEYCEFGGQKILVGPELDDDGNVDENASSTSIHYVCDGSVGPAGEPGDPGEDGDSLYVQKIEFEADNEDYGCDSGGVHFIFGTSIDNGEVPSDDIVEEATVCHGAFQEVSASVGDLDDPEDCDDAGGQKVTFSADGTELTSINVCDGVDGDDGCSPHISLGDDTTDEDGRTCRTVQTEYLDSDNEVCTDLSTDDFSVCDGRSVLVEDNDIDVGESECDGNGGVHYTFGYDTNGDGDIDEVLSEAELCNGADGSGTSNGGDAPEITTNVEEISDHEDCNGEKGTEISFEADGVPISETIVICDGEEGSQGADGCTPEVTIEPASDTNCPAGGYTTTTEYSGGDCEDIDAPDAYSICHGEDGEDGCGDILTWEEINENDADAMDQCPYGGKEITIHERVYDSNSDSCEIEDVRDTFFICDGADATDECQLIPFGSCQDADFADPDGEFAALEGDLSNLSLRYIDLRGANLDDVDMTNSDLTGARLNNASFENGIVVDANFDNADFSGADLSGTGTFDEDNLSTATFDSTTICPDRNLASMVNGEYKCAGEQLETCILRPNGSCSGFSICGQTISEDLTGVDLSNTEMRGVDLRGSVLSNATLDETKFGPGDCDDGDTYGPANLEGVPLDDVEASDADFVDTELDNTTFEGSTLETADFSGASINGSVSFLGADAEGAFFVDTELDGADFSEVPLSGADFTEAGLDNSTFSEAVLENATFTNADIDGDVSFERVVATGASFDGAELDGADFGDATLVEADFSGAVAEDSHFDGIDAYEADFSGANLNASSFVEVRAEYADFSGATLTGDTTFEGSTIRDADFSNTELSEANFDFVTVEDRHGHYGFPEDTTFADADFGTGATFVDADVRQTNFSGSEATGVVDFMFADLVGADFDNAELADAVFTDARLTNATFVEAYIPGLIGNGAMFYNVDFEDATVTDSYFDPILASTDDPNAHEFTDLRNTSFEGADLSGSTLAYADVNGATFMSATLTDVDLRGAEGLDSADGATWSNTLCPDFSVTDDDCTSLAASSACRLLEGGSCDSDHLEGLDSDDWLFGLRDRYVPEIDLSGANLQNANLEDSVLDEATFEGTDMRDADLSGVELEDAYFESVRISGTDFSDAELFNAEFTNVSNANGTVFTDAEAALTEFTDSGFVNVDFDFKASGVDFSGTSLSNVDFRNTVDFDDNSLNQLTNFVFDDVSFSGNVYLGPLDYEEVSMIGAQFTGSFTVQFDASNFWNGDLTGMCGIEDDDVENVYFDDDTTCPDGTTASGGSCTMYPDCSLL